MEIFSFNLITIGIVILILAVYRYLDKNNRSLEKVKKFSDKEQEKLSGFIDAKTREIQNLAIDLQVNLKTGKEILKRIGDSGEELTVKAQVLESVQKKILEYDTLIEELNGATVTVEGNIKKIREESDFVDRLSKQMKSAQIKITELETSIPVLRQEMSKKNEETAKIEKHKLLEEAGMKMQVFREETSHLEKKLKDYAGFMTKLESRTQAFESEAAKKLDSHLLTFEALVVEKRDLVAADLTAEVDTILKSANEQKAELASSVSFLVESSKAEITGVEDELRRAFETFKKDMRAMGTDLGKKLDAAREQGRHIEREVFDGCKGSIAKSAEEVKRFFDERLGKMNTAMDVSTVAFVDEMTLRQKEYETDFTEFMKKAEEGFNGAQLSNDARLLDIDAQIKALSQGIQSRLAEIEKQSIEQYGKAQSIFEQEAAKASAVFQTREDELRDESENVARIAGEIKIRLDRVEGDIEERVSALQSNFDESISGLESDVESKVGEIRGDLDESVSGLGAQMGAKLAKVRSILDESVSLLSNKLEKFDGGLGPEFESKLDAVRENLDARVFEMQTKIDASVSGLGIQMDTKLAKVRGVLEESVSGLSNKLEELDTRLVPELGSKIEGIRENFEASVSEMQEKIDASASGLGIQMDSRLAKVRGILEESVSVLSNKLEELDTGLVPELGSKIEGIRENFEASVSEMQEKIDASASGLGIQMDSKLAKVRGILEESVSVLSNKLEKFDSGLGPEFESKLDAVRENLDATVSGMQAKIDASASGLGIQMDSRLAKVRGILEESVSVLSNKLEKFDSGLGPEFESKLDAVRENLDATVSGMQAKIDESVSGLGIQMDSKLAKVRGIFEEKVSGLSNKLEELDTGLGSELGSKIENVRETLEASVSEMQVKIDESVSGFGTQMGTKLTEVRRNLEESVSGMQARIDELESGLSDKLGTTLNGVQVRLDGSVSAMQAKIEKLESGLANELGMKLNGMHHNLDEKVSEMRLKIDEIKSVLTDEITDASSDIEIKVMKRLDKQLADYENDLGYRLKKLEDTGVDISRLDENMRESIEEKKEEIKQQLSLFAKDLEDKALSEKSEHARVLKEMGESIKLLDTEVSELKSKAYREVSEKLRVFEDSFFTDLKTRQEKIEENLSKWESDVRESCDEKSKSFDDLASVFEKNVALKQAGQAKILKDLEATIFEVRREIEAISATASADFGEKLAGFEESVMRNMEERGQKIESTIDDWEKETKSTLDDKIHNFEEIVIDFQNLINEKKADQDTLLKELNEGMESVNKDLGVLREKSNKEFSEKIARFEEGFSEDLKSRGEKIENRIAQWQTTVNSNIELKIRNFEEIAEEKYSGFEAEWIKLINTKLGGVNDKFAGVQHQFDDYYDTLKKEMDSIEKKQAQLANQNQMFDKAGLFMGKLEKELAAIRTEMDEIEPQRKKLSQLDEEYKRMQSASEGMTKKVEETFETTNTKLKLIRSEMEKEKVAISSFVNTIDETIEGYRESFTAKIESHFQEVDLRVEELRKLADTTLGVLKNEFEGERDNLVSSTIGARKEITSQLDEMSKRVTTLSTQVEDNIESALGKFKEEMNSLEAGYSARAKSFEGTIDSKMGTFSRTMKEDQEKIKSLSERWFGRIETDYKTLLANITEIEKQQKNFESQTKLFERADKLKLELKSEIEELKRDLQVIEPERKKMNAMETELVKTQKATADVSGKIARFFAEKTKIDAMEKNIRQLVKVSESVEKRLENVTANHDVLQEIELKLRSIFDLEQKTETQFERLEKKNQVIETTTREVENNYKLLDDLEKHVKRIDESVKGLPDRISGISDQIKFLSENKQKADAAIEQVNKVSELLVDLEERMQKLQVAREWLSKTETRLETIGKNANEQLNLLKAIMKDDGGADNKKGKGAPSYDTRQMIIKLARQGWAVKEIAKASNVSQGEVELILELEPQKR